MPRTLGVDPKAPKARCNDCPLRDCDFVGGYGPQSPDRIIVGEAPGQTEVDQRRPFVGKAGRRLDETLSAKGVTRSSLYITNTVLCRPPGNKRPPRKAVSACH